MSNEDDNIETPPVPAPEPGISASEHAKVKAENERLREVSKKYSDLIKSQEAAEADAAAKRGEWEALATKAQAKAEKLQKELDSLAAEKAGLAEFVQAQVQSVLKGIEDPDTRKAWKAALDGLPPTKQHEMLTALQLARGSGEESPPSARAGAVKRQGNADIPDMRALRGDGPDAVKARGDLLTAILRGEVTPSE